MYTLWLDDDTHFTAHERTYTALKEAKSAAQLIPGFGQRYYIVGKGKLIVGKRGTMRALTLHDPPEPPKAEDWPEVDPTMFTSGEEPATPTRPNLWATYNGTWKPCTLGAWRARIYRGDVLVGVAGGLTTAKAMIPKERAPWVWRIVVEDKCGFGHRTTYEGRSQRSMTRCCLTLET